MFDQCAGSFRLMSLLSHCFVTFSLQNGRNRILKNSEFKEKQKLDGGGNNDIAQYFASLIVVQNLWRKNIWLERAKTLAMRWQ